MQWCSLNPGLYQAHKKARAAVITKAGMGNGQHLGRKGIRLGALCDCAFGPGLGEVAGVAQLDALGFAGRQGDAGPIRDQVALFLGEGGIQVEREGVRDGVQLARRAGRKDADADSRALRVERPARASGTPIFHVNGSFGILSTMHSGSIQVRSTLWWPTTRL